MVAREPAFRALRFGERSLLVRVTDQAMVHALMEALLPELHGGRLVDLVPGDRTLLVSFDGTDRSERDARAALRAARTRVTRERSSTPRRYGVIPVLYGGDRGPDLPEVARTAGLSEDEVIAAHSGRTYTVHFIGFAPGFPYLGEVDAAIRVPRLSRPRPSIPAGSVAIAESYAGIYPVDLPGGWRVIGWTPVTLFDPASDPPTHLQPGDTVRFEPVSAAEAAAWSGRAAAK